MCKGKGQVVLEVIKEGIVNRVVYLLSTIKVTCRTGLELLEMVALAEVVRGRRLMCIGKAKLDIKCLHAAESKLAV